jgi:hypothetical protein
MTHASTPGKVAMIVVGCSHVWSGARVSSTGLVYIAALAPDANETSQSQQAQFPVTEVFSYVEVAGGRVWMRPEGVACFAGDLPEEQQKLV